MDIIYTAPLFVICLVIAGGLLLGNITIGGIRLGSSGVLFAGMLAGYFQLTVPEGLGDIGLVLFAYCVGLSAGGRFFRALARDGSKLAILSIVMIVSALGLSLLAARLFDLPKYLSVGLFTGSMISTPGLAAATENLPAANAQEAIIGYGIAYPFAAIASVIFIQVLPKLIPLKNKTEDLREDVDDPAEPQFQQATVEVNNPNITGKNIYNYMQEHFSDCQVTRTYVDGRMVPLESGDTFQPGQKLLLFGLPRDISTATDLIGVALEDEYIKDVERERRRLIITNPAFAGKQLDEIKVLQTYGVMITTIKRLGVTFIPSMNSHLELNDQIICVGKPNDIARFSEEIGHRPIAFEKTDIISIFFGLTLGIIIGHIPLALPGTGSITLGIAGGPLILGLILGHFGRIGRVIGYIPRPVRMTLQEIGLVFFLAWAGVRSASGLEAAFSSYGLTLVLSGMVITLIPIMIIYLAGMLIFRFDLLTTLGSLCGNMRSSTALANVTSQTESSLPVISYATSYPIAMILFTIAAKISLWLF